MQCVVAGAGYVGVTTALVLVEKGHNVQAVDVDEARAQRLANGEVPFREPGVEAALRAALASGRFATGTDLVAASGRADAVFVCVGTPQKNNGDADLTSIKSAAKMIGQGLRQSAKSPLVVVKSTVPPGTATDLVVPEVERASRKKEGSGFHIVSNPEFLREGQALADSRNPDRVVVGAHRPEAAQAALELWRLDPQVPTLRTDPRTAELIKYASNAFLALKISYANEMANLASRIGVDVYEVMKGVGLDPRIGPQFLRAGAGFGGSCFPKDVRALDRFAKREGMPLQLPRALLEVNENQPKEVVRLLVEALGGSVRGKKVALLGLAFKPETDDVRETRALPILRGLEAEGATVTCWDPVAWENFRRLAGKSVQGSSDLASVLRGADAAVIQTEWPQLRELAAAEWRRLLKGDVVVDGRRSVDAAALEAAGLRYVAIGWKNAPRRA